ncbi:RNA-directed DNA polymerase from mobile element jockey [Trichonephila clavata]|uniref:RNA-directed DNA polymerase from mobile element jockey n=1 Tax=Trichonephila clavata TaxID=2740835 RepID=A0A8X6H6G3_TRICU|nr:RNA-directed DNA polymerase from mobile element jockey [Trichonephila clavata]
MPADMPVNEVIENLEELGIHPKECRVLNNRKTGQPMPIFSVFLEKNEDNRNIYNLKELCFMKIVVETMRGKIGPAQCYRCQGFFHGSRFCTRNPKCVKCGKPHLTKDCTKTKNEEPTCCHCQGNHPANFLGCPQNPLNRPPPPPKVNFWEERARIKKEMQEAAKNKITPPAPPTSQQNNQTEETSSSHPPQTSSSTHQPQTKFVPRQVQMMPSKPEPRRHPRPPGIRNRPLKLVTWNADGVLQKIPELEEYIDRHDPDVIALQETFLRPCHSLNFPNYITYRNNRRTHRGGGTAIIIKKSIAHHSIEIPTNSIQNTTIVIEETHNITICSIYRPPKQPPQALIPDLLRILRNRTKCFIVGDYNAKHQTWSPHSTINQCGRVLNKFIKNCGFLLSYSSEPTIVPYRTNQRPATIDFGISCRLDNILVETQAELSSDHNPVQFIIPEANNSPYAQNCTTFTNWNRFQELLTTSVPGNPKINNTEEIEANIDQLTNHIHNAINQSSKIKQQDATGIHRIYITHIPSRRNPPLLPRGETSFIAAAVIDPSRPSSKEKPDLMQLH